MRKIALLPALWIALSAAAPQNSPMLAAAQCELSPDGFLAAIKTFSVKRQVERGVAPDRLSSVFYDVPAGFTVHGYPVAYLALSDELSSTDDRKLLMSAVEGDYEDVERTVLAATRTQDCNAREDDGTGKTCHVYARQVDGWRVAVVVKQLRDTVGIACSVSRRPA